jgi:hypothetical protein
VDWLQRAANKLPRAEVADTIVGGIVFLFGLWLVGDLLAWIAAK